MEYLVNYPSRGPRLQEKRGQETTDADSLALLESDSEEPGAESQGHRRPQQSGLLELGEKAS